MTINESLIYKPNPKIANSSVPHLLNVRARFTASYCHVPANPDQKKVTHQEKHLHQQKSSPTNKHDDPTTGWLFLHSQISILALAKQRSLSISRQTLRDSEPSAVFTLSALTQKLKNREIVSNDELRRWQRNQIVYTREIRKSLENASLGTGASMLLVLVTAGHKNDRNEGWLACLMT